MLPLSPAFSISSISPVAPLPGQDDLRRMFNAELKLLHIAAGNAVDFAFRVAELNLYVLKQAAANWSDKSEDLQLTDASLMPAWFDSAHLEKDLGNLSAYAQQIGKLMLDSQAGLSKLALQRVTQSLQEAAVMHEVPANRAAPAATADFPALDFIQNLVDQAGKGYAQWSSQARELLAAAQPAAPAAEPAPKQAKVAAAKSRARKPVSGQLSSGH